MNSVFTRRTPIGLDIGAHSVKAVQSTRSRQGWKVAASARFSRAKPDAPLACEELTDIIDILHRQGFIGRDIVTVANSEKLMSGVLELPARKPDVPFDQIARGEFGRIHKCDPGACEFAWWELPAPARAGKFTHVMAIALPHRDADEQLALFDRAKIHVRALDTAASALGRACLSLCPASQTVAALDLGWKAATLVLVRNGILAYERRFTAGGMSHLHAALAARFGMDAIAVEQLVGEISFLDPPSDTAQLAAQVGPLIASHLDAIVAEVQKTRGYAQHQYPDGPLETLLLSGGGACIRGLDEHLKSILGMEVRLAQPSFESADSDGKQRLTASHAFAAALAAFPN